MAPTLILVRHAQALHNVNYNYTLMDPVLSDLGVSQCDDLSKSLLSKIPHELDVGLIVVSPMRRTIQTALLAFAPLIEKGVPVVADARWQENSAARCDTGSPLATLMAEFPQVDFSQVDPVWPDKTTAAGAAYAYNRNAILTRGQSALRDLAARPEKAIIVVSHSSFLRQGLTGRWFMNADYRIFDFEERTAGESDEDFILLKQWESTLTTGGLGWSKEEVVPIGHELPEGMAR
ncbi:histidine phosphatase superfamily [Podospora appendiculata]|uniref:Histidine phosphatase superfamily n=1 Tax=Podospora appendiculata TaxID=314037 RepID=A0AAE0X1F9_9PEZI|nr:histidine phosphatase superfamily [Podospora appendiculata]